MAKMNDWPEMVGGAKLGLYGFDESHEIGNPRRFAEYFARYWTPDYRDIDLAIDADVFEKMTIEELHRYVALTLPDLVAKL